MAASLAKRVKINHGDIDIKVEPSDSQQIKVEPSGSEAASNVEIKQFKIVSQEEYLQYLKAARKSQGFDVPQLSIPIPNGISPLDIDEDSQEFLTEISKQALDEYNRNAKAAFQFVKLVKANHQVVAGRMYYIKFEAKEGEGNCQNFRAKVWRKLRDEGREVELCEKI